MKPFHRTGKLVLLSGTSPRRTGRSSIQVGSGRTLRSSRVTRSRAFTGVNCLAGLKQAVGNLDKVAIVRTLNFVVCTPEFYGLTSRSRRMRPTGGRSRGRRRAVSCSFPKSETSTRSSRS